MLEKKNGEKNNNNTRVSVTFVVHAMLFIHQDLDKHTVLQKQ